MTDAQPQPGVAGRRAVLCLVGFLIAAVSSICGIGGGIFAVPILHYAFGLPLRRAVATALCLVCAVATAATISEFFHPESALFLFVAVALATTSLVGAQLGYWISKRLKTRSLKALFCVVLLFVGSRLVFLQPQETVILATPDVAFGPSAGVLGMCAAIGLLAGIAVPLLGVGGGLIVVPSLLFLLPACGLPGIGYLGARAASLAMATVTSTRSIFLFARERAIDWHVGGWFALGAAAGAAGGVVIVHMHGAAEVGQVLLGVVLSLAGLRFGIDVLRARAAASAR